MQDVRIQYRGGDVGDGFRFEASVGDVSGAGDTPAQALETLAAAAAIKHGEAPELSDTLTRAELDTYARALGLAGVADLPTKGAVVDAIAAASAAAA